MTLPSEQSEEVKRNINQITETIEILGKQLDQIGREKLPPSKDQNIKKLEVIDIKDNTIIHHNNTKNKAFDYKPFEKTSSTVQQKNDPIIDRKLSPHHKPTNSKASNMLIFDETSIDEDLKSSKHSNKHQPKK